jgi:hypothetical protein
MSHKKQHVERQRYCWWRDQDTCSLKTRVAFAISGVSKENTSGGHGCQFMNGFGGEVGIVGLIEHEQVLI